MTLFNIEANIPEDILNVKVGTTQEFEILVCLISSFAVSRGFCPYATMYFEKGKPQVITDSAIIQDILWNISNVYCPYSYEDDLFLGANCLWPETCSNTDTARKRFQARIWIRNIVFLHSLNSSLFEKVLNEY